MTVDVGLTDLWWGLDDGRVATDFAMTPFMVTG